MSTSGDTEWPKTIVVRFQELVTYETTIKASDQDDLDDQLLDIENGEFDSLEDCVEVNERDIIHIYDKTNGVYL